MYVAEDNISAVLSSDIIHHIEEETPNRVMTLNYY